MDLKQMLNICPTESELSEIVTVHLCNESGCNSTFKKISNLQMHLVKHHKIGQFEPKPKSVNLRYFCPRDDCVYNISFSNGKFFNEKRLLKQHFMKVHASKNYSCDKCGLKTSIASTYKRHIKVCGVKFSCGACGWEYNSNESLLVHLMRKHPHIHTAYMQNKSIKQKDFHAKNEQTSIQQQSDFIHNEKPAVIYNGISNNLEHMKKETTIIKNTSAADECLLECGRVYKEIETNCNPDDFNSIKLEHNYVSFINCSNLEERSYKKFECISRPNEIKYVNIVKKNEGDKLNLSLVSVEKNPSYVLVPINLFNKNNLTEDATVNGVISSFSSTESNDNLPWSVASEIIGFNSPITNKTAPTTKCLSHKDTYTQTSLKLCKKLNNLSVDKSSVETQTFNHMCNPSKTKNKIKHVDAMTQSIHNRKQKSKFMMLSQIKNKKKHKNFKKHCDVKNIQRKRNECHNIVCKNSDNANSIYSLESNELYTDKEVNNQKHNSCKNEIKSSQIISVNNKFTNILKSHETTDAIMNDDIINESNINCEVNDNFSNSMDFNCQFDYEDTITQSSDIETQTALDELLYSNTSKCDDIHDSDIFSELISLSDIQTQTTWPLNYTEEMLEQAKNNCIENKKQNSVLISTETQTTDDIAQDQNSFDFGTSSYSYEMDKNSPFFDGTSPHFCFKETQTCFCFLDSPKFEDSLNQKIIQDISLLEGSQNDISKPAKVCTRNLNDAEKPSLCISTSAETQTQFSFENSQFLSRKSDVLLSCSTIETQTCFESDYLEDIIDVNRGNSSDNMHTTFEESFDSCE